MKIQSLEIKDFPPIKHLKIENLDDIVILAGANGSGKTRLKEAIVTTLQGASHMSLTLKATRQEEEKKFQGKTTDMVQGQPNQIVMNYIRSRKFGFGKYVGSLVQIDSQRNIQAIQYRPVNYLPADPDDTETPSTFYCQDFQNRWNDFMKYIHNKIAAHKSKLADEVTTNPSETGDEYLRKHPYPLEKYKNIFAQMLPGKELQDIDPSRASEFRYKDANNQILPFGSLSSGEQEVIKILFDVARKDIRHSIIIVDEPELHLHPTLAFSLVEALKSIGDHTNQLIFLTHSADLISTYYSTGNVYFIDSTQEGENQAHKLRDLIVTHNEVTKLIGENLGLFAVGKMLIFVEGEDSSIDRLTYHSIAQKYLPEAKIIPVGSVENIGKLGAFEKQIRNSIFGIELYMIRDRDSLTEDDIRGIEKNGRVKCLKKRHIENYFLDSEILFKVARKLYITESKSHITQQFIEGELRKIANDSVKLNLAKGVKDYIRLKYHFDVPRLANAERKDLDAIKQDSVSEVEQSIERLNADIPTLRDWMDEEQRKLETALSTGDWKNIFRGKEIYSKFCAGILETDKSSIRRAYIDIVMEENVDVFKDIIDILKSFKKT